MFSQLDLVRRGLLTYRDFVQGLVNQNILVLSARHEVLSRIAGQLACQFILQQLRARAVTDPLVSIILLFDILNISHTTMRVVGTTREEILDLEIQNHYVLGNNTEAHRLAERRNRFGTAAYDHLREMDTYWWRNPPEPTLNDPPNEAGVGRSVFKKYNTMTASHSSPRPTHTRTLWPKPRRRALKDQGALQF